MLTFTDKAKEQITAVLAGAEPGCAGLRVRANKIGNYTFRYQLQVLAAHDVQGDDVAYDAGGFKVHLDPSTSTWMNSASIDFVTDEQQTGFKINNPTAEPIWENPLGYQVDQVIKTKLAPMLAQHNGWMELLRVEGDTAYVHLGGGCRGCSSAQATMTQAVEQMIVREVPQIKRVIDETDHKSACC